MRQQAKRQVSTYLGFGTAESSALGVVGWLGNLSAFSSGGILS